MLDQKEMLIYTSHWTWHYRRTRSLLHLVQRRGSDLDVIDTADDAELCASHAHFKA